MNDVSVSERCGTLLPWFVAGSLTAPDAAEVERHLATCAACAAQRDTWQLLAVATRSASRAIEPPLSHEASWEQLALRLGTQASAAATVPVVATRRYPSAALWARRLAGAYAHFARVLMAQARTLPSLIWLASLLGIALAAAVAAAIPSAPGACAVLTLALPLVAAAGMAFLYGPEIDPGLEIALATPTSARTVMLGRFLLLFGFDAAVAVAASIAPAARHGGGLLALTLLWLGPMALLATLSLLVSLLLGPAAAGIGAALLWVSRAMRFHSGVELTLAPSQVWHTSLPVLLVSALLLVAALLYVPRSEQHVPR